VLRPASGVLLLLLIGWVPLRAEDPKSLLGLGLGYLEHNRYDEAIEALVRAVRLDPSLTLAHYDLGVCYFALGQFDAARREFGAARRLSPEHRFTTYYLARLDLLDGNLDGAIRGFESLSAVRPLADELYYLGSAYFRKGETEPAIQSLQKAIVFQPEDYRAYFLLARVYQKTGREKQAKEQFALSEKFRGADRRKASDMLACDAAFDSQDRDRALARCRELLDGADPIKLVSLGIALADRKMYEAALAPFAKAARLDPENFEPQYNLGLTYFKLKKYSEAKAPLEIAFGLRSEYFEAVALLGSTLFALGDDDNAVTCLRHAHQLKPGDEKVTLLLVQELNIIARHLEASGERAQSVALLEEARGLQPQPERK
jgi:tetratricopeptide (TPR) repeat protein